MTSRRIISNEKTVLDKDDATDSSPSASKISNISPVVSHSVIVKLLAFTLAMMIGPLAAYYLTLRTIFKGNSVWAGATAAITANVVLIAYVVVAFYEDQSESLAAEEEDKKAK
ncbi:MAG: vacuolar ATPase assembly integral membrane protein vma21 [Candelina submexicana]|nr:MAG: vacuolar ATPase assembly integral membrane protein vma21 [Candelina submexicana]